MLTSEDGSRQKAALVEMKGEACLKNSQKASVTGVFVSLSLKTNRAREMFGG